MKKVISLVLCTIMIASLFAISVSAAIPVPIRTVDLGCNNGEGTGVSAFATAQVSSGAAATKTVDGTNNVYEFSFTQGGTWNGSTRYYVLYSFGNFIGGLYDDKDFEIKVDVKPIVNSTGIGFSLHPAGYRGSYQIRPANFTEGSWSTVKFYWDSLHKIANFYVKGQNDAEYRLLTSGTDYYKNANNAISSGSSFLMLDTVCFKDDMASNAYDTENILNAKYYIDNFSVTRYDKVNNKNILYTDDTEIEFNTSLGSGGLEYKFASAIDYSASTRSIVFDAVKTGGDRPVNVTFAPANKSVNSTTFAFNIWNAPQDVKYTYKVDYYQGSLSAISRKAEGSNVWETLTAGVDYSKGGPYGAWQYFKFGYLGELYENDATHLAEYCGPNPALDDVNTKWTFSNFQITGHDPAVTATVKETSTGSIVTVGAVAQSTDFAVMVAVYDGETFAGAGVANISHEGVADIAIDHNVESPTFKAYVWDMANGAAPMMEITDITSWVE